jgi:crotonobetaine/carnitine-CoA ligase
VAVVVLVEGSPFDPAAFFRACEQQLERNQLPSYLQVPKEVPKTASEKPIDRFLIGDLANRRSPVYESDDYAG